MPKYSVSYRGEFAIDVDAKDKEEALEKAQKIEDWKNIYELHPDFFEIRLIEERELLDRIEDIWDTIDVIGQHLEYASSPKGLREKANFLLKIADLKEQYSNKVFRNRLKK